VRRATLNLLRCPRCRRGGLLTETDAPDIAFGPARCTQCQASYPIAEGLLDVLGDRQPPGWAQQAFEQAWIARAYEHRLRPLIQRVVARERMDPNSEYLLYRSLLGKPEGPILDLACGTGLFARLLAREPDVPAAIGMDVSRPMLEEALAQAREHGAAVDFIRAEAPELPFANASIGAVLQARALYLFCDVNALFDEVARVLRPGGRYVASTYLPPRFGAALQRRVGLYPRSEADLRGAMTRAGLVQIERLLLSPSVVFKAEKPGASAAAAPGR